MPWNRINLELIKTGRRGLDVWLSCRNELIPLCHMDYHDVIPYVHENAKRVMTYEDPVLVGDFPKKINEYFNGLTSSTIDSFFRAYFDDVISEELKQVLEEERIETRPLEECRIYLRFRKNFDLEVSSKLKL